VKILLRQPIKQNYIYVRIFIRRSQI